MRQVAQIAQAFYKAVAAGPTLKKVEFIMDFSPEDLKQTGRTPLFLISPHRVYTSASRYRQEGSRLLFDTYLFVNNRRGDRNYNAALEVLTILDDIDARVLHQTFDLAIQPLNIYYRSPGQIENNLSLVRTVYDTLIYDNLSLSKFEYQDNNILQIIEFNYVPTFYQLELKRDHNDYDRALDGTLRSYSRRTKLKYEIRFILISSFLKDQLLAMKNADTEISYYRDKTGDKTMTCLWVNDFDFTEEKPGYWTGRMVLQEI